jgi:hypothetical protein
MLMDKKKLPQEFEITELFLVKAGNDYRRTFIAQIRRETTKEGKTIVRGSVEVTDGKLWSVAESQEELGKFLDNLCVMKLDMGFHSHAGVTIKTCNEEFFLN